MQESLFTKMTNSLYDILIFHLAGGWGGAEKTTINIFNALSPNYRVVILTNRSEFRHATGYKTTVIVAPFKWWFCSWKDIVKDIFHLGLAIKHLRPRAVIGIMPYAAFLASILRRIGGRRFLYIGSPRGSCLNYLKHFVPPPKRPKYRFFFLTAFALADYFLTPSRLSLQDYIQHFHVSPRKAIVIPNGIFVPNLQIEKVLSLREKSWDNPKVIWFGRISLEKRLDFILKSFGILSQSNFRARLVMVGDGDGNYKHNLEQYANELGISEQIEWVGYQKNVIPFLLKSHLSLHACMWEEFGYTIAESIAAGLPVIAYDCPYGPREILDGGRYGILVKTEDEMAEAMKELLENISFWRELSQRSFLRARDFDIKKISEKYREAFKKILG